METMKHRDLIWSSAYGAAFANMQKGDGFFMYPNRDQLIAEYAGKIADKAVEMYLVLAKQNGWV